MKLLLLGANGRVGSILVRKALRNGHTVTAFVHGDSKLPQHDNIKIVKGDIYNKQEVVDAISGVDAVASTLSSWGTPKKDVLTTAMKHVIPIMETAGIQRIVSLTGADARDETDKLGIINLVTRPLLKVIAGKILQDGEQHIVLLRNSSLEWTVVRSPIMNNRPSAGYELTYSRPLPWQTIYRDSVAEAMLAILEEGLHVNQTPFIHRRT